VVLLLVVVGAGLRLLFRRSDQGSPVAQHTDIRNPERQAAPRPGPGALPQAPTLAAENEPPAQADAGLPTPRTEVEMLRQRQRLLADNFELARQQAAELLFVRLGISEDKRAAIRLMNQRLARWMQSVRAERLGGGPPPVLRLDGMTPGTGNPGIDREAALTQILGVATAASYRKLERTAIRNIQSRFIAKWDTEMEKIKFPPPPPPGLAP
jgi:hypothetical protein